MALDNIPKKKVDNSSEISYNNKSDKMKIKNRIKELSLQLANYYDLNLRIEINVGLDCKSVKMNITEVNS